MRRRPPDEAIVEAALRDERLWQSWEQGLRGRWRLTSLDWSNLSWALAGWFGFDPVVAGLVSDRERRVDQSG